MSFSKVFGMGEARKKLEAHRLRLYRIAYSWTHNSALADDLTQETLTKALIKSSQLRDPNSEPAWLYSILANCYRDHFRRQRDMEQIDDLDLADDADPERDTDQIEIVRRVRAAMCRLSRDQRQVVSLVDIEGFSYVEVAQILSVPIGTVMSRLCRARAALKVLLSNDVATLRNQHGALLRRIK